MSGDLFGGKPEGGAGRRTEDARRPPRTAPDRPLADRLRPTRLDELVGQDHLLAPDAPLGRMLARRRLASTILWGPPGSGKTTLARLLAATVGEPMLALSAVMSGVADLRRAFQEARRLRARGRRPILFIDEIHRFNRAQQDALLHEVEDGTVTLIGTTTENPSFALNPALVSRCHVLVLRRLSEEDLARILARAEERLGRQLPLTDEARRVLLELADGDARALLNMVEVLADLPETPALAPEALGRILRRRVPVYDRQYEQHYNLISALHKSVRGSDPDAALYWLARMLEAGEDPRYLARRLIRIAYEDVGLADPMAAVHAVAAAETYERLGSPEGELALAQVAVYLALAPKSNAVYRAYDKARESARRHGSLMPPLHILNAPTPLMKKLGYGRGYRYDHDEPDRFSGQDYFPEEMGRERYYEPTVEGEEARLAERLRHLERLRAARRTESATDREKDGGDPDGP